MRCEVTIEVPRGSLIKWGAEGVDFISPLPSPVNYGSVLGRMAADGDAQDAIVLGPRLRRGLRLECEVLGVVRFYDQGVPDHKWICALGPRALPRRRLLLFFHIYAAIKRLRHPARPSRCGGVERCGG